MPRKLLLPVFTVLVLGLGIALTVFLFKVSNVSIISEKPCFSKEELLKEVDATGKSIFLVSADKLSLQIKNKFSCIADLKISKKLPSTLVLDYKGKVPVAKLDGSENQLTADGLVIKSVSSDQVPAIFLPPNVNPQLGEQLKDPRILLSLQLADLLAKSDFAPSNIRFVNQTITIYNQQEAIAIFSTEKPALEQTNALQQVLAKAKIDSKKISKIDMRFNNPIIVFK